MGLERLTEGRRGKQRQSKQADRAERRFTVANPLHGIHTRPQATEDSRSHQVGVHLSRKKGVDRQD